jgi:hypothetical protein
MKLRTSIVRLPGLPSSILIAAAFFGLPAPALCPPLPILISPRFLIFVLIIFDFVFLRCFFDFAAVANKKARFRVVLRAFRRAVGPCLDFWF